MGIRLGWDTGPGLCRDKGKLASYEPAFRYFHWVGMIVQQVWFVWDALVNIAVLVLRTSVRDQDTTYSIQEHLLTNKLSATGSQCTMKHQADMTSVLLSRGKTQIWQYKSNMRQDNFISGKILPHQYVMHHFCNLKTLTKLQIPVCAIFYVSVLSPSCFTVQWH